MKYPYLLLDADNTLFDFDAGNRHAFHEVCARYDIPDTEESFQCYKRCNNAMWAAFDRGECTKDFLVVERFRRFLKEMGLDRPVLERYASWVTGFFHGDLGTSYSYSMPVGELIRDKVPITIAITVIAFLMILVVSIPIGIFTAPVSYTHLTLPTTSRV